MSNAAKVKQTTQKKDVVEKVVTDAAEGLTFWSVASLIWRFFEPHAIEVVKGVGERFSKEHRQKRGNIGGQVPSMDPAKRKILLERLRAAVNEGSDTRVMSQFANLNPGPNVSFKELLEQVADMDQADFETLLLTQDTSVAKWLRSLREESREILRRDFGFVAEGARAAGRQMRVFVQDTDAAAERLAPSIQAFADTMRRRREERAARGGFLRRIGSIFSRNKHHTPTNRTDAADRLQEGVFKW